MRRTRATAVAALGLLAALEAGCFVHVTHESDPTSAFLRARDEASRVRARDVRATELNVLAWDPGDREMVRVSVPLWLVRQADRHADWDMDYGDERDRERWRRRMDRMRWEDIERAGPGILLEVTEDEGERVLVWLR
jgi:hypothetical protein